ncbi:hypoxanthine-guanine phosphoribosyltransferase [Thioalkalivibrio sp. HK1]|uniref:hypoxanthine-guanine phosphoribosyltransferase n=1 Tax=Thioalkalivibrio sp. HK1 TaxID=1469245 RepID=UPI000472A337|nr:hypoxanthine-guanine phosphoribosyltransferase [Thioalkalivibrio sp. HK1]
MSLSTDPSEYRRVLDESDVICSEAEVDAAYRNLAEEIGEVYRERSPLILPVMVGGLIPAARILAHLDFPLSIDYVHVTRYRGSTRGRTLEWFSHPSTDLKDRSVLVVDDILDEGVTLSAILEHCQGLGACDVRCAVLVDKQLNRSRVLPEADFAGLRVEDRYVFGCGMDYRGFFRNLPGIHALSPEEAARA